MGAKVLDRGNPVFSGAIEDDFFTTNLPAQGFVGNFIGGARDVPGVFWVHDQSPDQVLLLLWIH